MKALVTGASGFIGSHIADYLLDKGFEVRCNVRESSSLKWLKDKPIEIVNASLSNKDSLSKAVEGVDYIFHSAGLTYGNNPNDFMTGNRDGTKNLLEAVLSSNHNLKRFVFLSSLTVSGPAKSLTEPITEEMPCNPLTSYGKSKKAAEDEVLNLRNKIPITIVRAPAVYGPRETAIYSVFKGIKMGIGSMVGLKPKYVSLIHSNDLVRGIADSAFSDKTIGEIYFVSSEEFYTWNDLIPLMAEIMGKKFVLKIRLPHTVVLATAGISGFMGKFSSKPPVFNYEKGIDFIQNYWICSVEKAKRDFNFRQQMSIRDGMIDTINWYKNNNWL